MKLCDKCGQNNSKLSLLFKGLKFIVENLEKRRRRSWCQNMYVYYYHYHHRLYTRTVYTFIPRRIEAGEEQLVYLQEIQAVFVKNWTKYAHIIHNSGTFNICAPPSSIQSTDST